MNVLSGALLVLAAAMLAVGALIATAIDHRTADPATFCGVVAFGVAAFGVWVICRELGLIAQAKQQPLPPLPSRNREHEA